MQKLTFLSVLSLLISVFLSYECFALEPIYLEIIINGDKKGAFLFYIDDHNFYLKKSDLISIGIKNFEGPSKIIDGNEYILVNEINGLQNLKFDESTMSLILELSPYLLDKNIIDFYPTKKKGVYYPEAENSVFLNYRFDVIGKDNFETKSFFLTNELGINFNNFLLLNETLYEKDNNKDNFIRLQSSFFKDNRDKMTRLIIGDFITPSDAFSGGQFLGGISYSKQFKLDPYFIYRPTLTIEGAVKNKSELEVYLDGVLLRKEHLNPGEFNLKDIYYYSGQREIEIIIKDTYGRVEREIYPFYFTDIILKKDVSDYSYNLGFLRKNYGSKSNKYDIPVLNFYHRYGYNDKFTLGLSSEICEKTFFISPDISYFKANFGVLNLKGYLNKNKESDRFEYAYLTNYNYTKKQISYGLSIRHLTEDFKTLSYDNTKQKINYEIKGTFGYYSNQYGSYTIDLLHKKIFKSNNENEFLFSYSKSLLNQLSIYLNLRKGLSGTNVLEAFFGINYYFDKKVSLSYFHSKTNKIDSDRLQVSKNSPIGEGVGYRIALENIRSEGNNVTQISPYIEYKTPYNIFIADISFEDYKGQIKDYVNLSASGAILYIAGHVGFTRPVNDSFAMIKADNLNNIPIYFNNEEVAETNKEGIAFIPNINSYSENIIEIPAKKVSLQYSLLKDKVIVSPPYRYGTCLNLPIKKVYRYEGYLKISKDGAIKSVSFKEFQLKKLERIKKEKEKEKEICKSPLGQIKEIEEGTFFTSIDGEFYLENVLPGKYLINFVFEGKEYENEFELPDSESILINLGEIIIEDKAK